MNAYELAKLYYPHLWSRERIDMLVKAGKLTKEEAEEITEQKE